MYIYNILALLFFFIRSQSFNSINHNKRNFYLFSKKNKNIGSYLYSPKNINQEKYLNFLNNDTNKIIIATGPAGTGKTLLACQKAITQLKNEELDKIIITRPIVTIEEDIGFLPGNINKKMEPWTKPIFDIFLEYYSKTEIDMLLNNGKIEICPLVFMRGRTFKNSFIIADEMQNSSPNQMKMLVTRIGVNSRMIITGDLNQTDIIKENGLYDFIFRIEKYNNTELIKIINFDYNDIERSDIVKKVIEIYNYKPYNYTNILVKKHITSTCTSNCTSNCSSNSSIPNKKIYNKLFDSSILNNDAALIPKHHMSKIPYSSHNYDIFFESREF